MAGQCQRLRYHCNRYLFGGPFHIRHRRAPILSTIVMAGAVHVEHDDRSVSIDDGSNRTTSNDNFFVVAALLELELCVHD